jgi:putative LysE/RhtB family amino acid efflux pump
LGKRIHLTPWRSHSIATELTGGISALPFGPMGILCLQRTLDQGRRAGMIAAAGIVVALGLWGVMVAQGMHQVSV